jgi:hypothetical protein
MPFELGLFLGCKMFGKNTHSGKSCLILEYKQHQYDRFFSDISGQDIRAHGNSPKAASEFVRNFLSEKTERLSIPSPSIIWGRYVKFRKTLPKLANEYNQTVKELTFRDRSEIIKSWLDVKAPG